MPSPFNCSDCKDTGWIHVPDGLGCIAKDLCDCKIYLHNKENNNEDQRSLGHSREENFNT